MLKKPTVCLFLYSILASAATTAFIFQELQATIKSFLTFYRFPVKFSLFFQFLHCLPLKFNKKHRLVAEVVSEHI